MLFIPILGAVVAILMFSIMKSYGNISSLTNNIRNVLVAASIPLLHSEDPRPAALCMLCYDRKMCAPTEEPGIEIKIDEKPIITSKELLCYKSQSEDKLTVHPDETYLEMMSKLLEDPQLDIKMNTDKVLIRTPDVKQPSKDNQEGSLGLFEGDDDFDEFPADEWSDNESIPAWQNDWDDDVDEEDFNVKLQAMNKILQQQNQPNNSDENKI